jgi:hypothetical protein
MDEMLTIEEIEARYAPGWVLIAEPQTDDMQRVLGGKVVFHSPDRSAVWEKFGEWKLDGAAVRYLGEYPEHLAIHASGFGLPIFVKEADVDETLTWDEIKARYAPDWVIIDELETDDHLEVVRGKVIFHGPDADELLRKMAGRRFDRIAVLYLGEYPEHMVIGL